MQSAIFTSSSGSIAGCGTVIGGGKRSGERTLREVQQMMRGGSLLGQTETKHNILMFKLEQFNRRGNVGYIMLSLYPLSYLHPPAAKLVNFSRKCEYHYPTPTPLHSLARDGELLSWTRVMLYPE